MEKYRFPKNIAKHEGERFYKVLRSIYHSLFEEKGKVYRKEVLKLIEKKWKGSKTYIEHYKKYVENYTSILYKKRRKEIYENFISIEDEVTKQYLSNARGGI